MLASSRRCSLSPTEARCVRSPRLPTHRVSPLRAAAIRSLPAHSFPSSLGQLSSVSSVDVFSPMVCHATTTKAERRAIRREEREAMQEPEGTAILRFARGSPHKMRRVIDTIRGRSYEDALIILEYLPYRATEPILKTLLSAAANAKHNLGMKKTRLFVSQCYVDEAPVFKRFRARAKGRGASILKRNSHITIKVKEKPTETQDVPEAEVVQETPNEAP